MKYCNIRCHGNPSSGSLSDTSHAGRWKDRHDKSHGSISRLTVCERA